MSALGRLSIALGLDAAQFFDGMTKAEYKANKFAQVMGAKMGSAAKIATTGLLAVQGAATGLLLALDQLNKAAADFQDFAEITGASAESLASLKTAIDVGGGSIESTVGALNKLTKGLAGADEETKGAAQAVKALGFNLEEFQQLDPAAQYEAIAFALAEFEDGAGKTAAAMALMGKSGAEQLPIMKALVEQGGRQVILTDEMIAQADAYADAQTKLRSQTQQYLQALATTALPALNALFEAFNDLIKGFFDVDQATGKLKDTGDSLKEFGYGAARAFAFLVDSADGVQRTFRVLATVIGGVAALPVGNYEGLKRGLADIKDQVDNILLAPTFGSKLEAAISRIKTRAAAEANAFEGNFVGGGKKRLDPALFGAGKTPKKDTADAERKAALDKQLSDLDNFAKEEDRILSLREATLERFYSNDQISINDYFSGRRAALEENIGATVAIYDKQIAALEEFASKQSKSEAKLATEAKIGDLKTRRDEELFSGAEKLRKLDEEKLRSAQAYEDQVSELTAKLLELQGTEEAAAEAALIRFDIQNRSFRRRATAQGDTDAIAANDKLRDNAKLQAEVNSLMGRASVIQGTLANTEGRLLLEREVGLRGELQTLGLLGQSRQAAVAQLDEIARKYEEIALASTDPQAIIAAEAFRLKVDEIAASADVLGDKLRNTFVDSFANAFDAFVMGTMSAKDAFRSFANDVISQINRMLATELATSIFGQGGVGGIFTAIAGAFTGGAGQVFAEGGYPPVNKVSLVGERGPELFVPTTAGKIIPNRSLGGTTVEQTVNFLLPSAVTKSTQNQIAARAGIATQRAINRGVAA